LGVAVYKAFGIGLGYNFDHMSELGEGEEPTPRRLQARAAKSAVRRYNELNDAEKNLVTKMNESKDPNEREHYQKLLEKSKKKFDKEIKYLAGRLKELIPTTSTIEEFGLMDTTKFRMKPESTIRKVSPDEYRKLEEDPLGFDEKSIGSEIV
jgi:predicted nuclease with TOPRIM domain